MIHVIYDILTHILYKEVHVFYLESFKYTVTTISKTIGLWPSLTVVQLMTTL